MVLQSSSNVPVLRRDLLFTFSVQKAKFTYLHTEMRGKHLLVIHLSCVCQKLSSRRFSGHTSKRSTFIPPGEVV